MYQILKVLFLFSLSSGLMSKEINHKRFNIYPIMQKSGLVNEIK
jgi:hypothetical protein